MKLKTHDDFGNAKRNMRTILAYDIADLEFVDEENPKTSALAGRGYIISFDENIVSILNEKVGVIDFFRDKFEFYEEPQPVN